MELKFCGPSIPSIHQGKFKDGTLVAVKKLSETSKQGVREFLNEVVVISQVQHRNLVRLRGCCVEGRHRLLVYEFLENRSLRQSLLGQDSSLSPMFWKLNALASFSLLIWAQLQRTQAVSKPKTHKL